MKVGSYTSYLGYPVDGSKAREIKVTYNIHENKCNGKKTSPIHVRFRYNLLTAIKNRL